jgi:hypothetical protein
MALIKMLRIGEELLFDLTAISPNAKSVLVSLTEKAGKMAVLKIEADKSINIVHLKDNGETYFKEVKDSVQ